MTRTRRDALWLICQVTSAATIGLQGCGTDTNSMSPPDMPKTPDSIHSIDPEDLNVISRRLPLSELAPLIEGYLTDRTTRIEQDPLRAIGPLGEQWFNQQIPLEASTTTENLGESLGFMTSLPPDDITPELITDRIAAQYDTLEVVEVGGWWMTQIEAAFCSIAFLVLRERTMDTQSIQPA